MPSQWHHLQCQVSALFLTAPEDGVAPSILLTVQDNRGKPFAQYLYNIPDGASRLMLEHRARPGLQLNALFLSGTSPAEAGGLGSLVLRLKQDGHANLQLVGPHGIYHCLQGIRSFIPWTHPCIRMTEAQPALIKLPPCTKPGIRLQGIQRKPTTRQKLRRDAQHQAAQQHHKQQQGRLQTAVRRWRKKQQARGLQDGPESPFVMLSYADKYTKTVGFGICLNSDNEASSSDGEGSDGGSSSDGDSDKDDEEGPAGPSQHTAPASAAAVAAAGGPGKATCRADRAATWELPDWLLPMKGRREYFNRYAAEPATSSSRGTDSSSSSDEEGPEAAAEGEPPVQDPVPGTSGSSSADSSDSGSDSGDDDQQEQQQKRKQRKIRGLGQGPLLLGKHARFSNSTDSSNTSSSGGSRHAAARGRRPQKKQKPKEAAPAVAAAGADSDTAAVAAAQPLPVSATAMAAHAFLRAAAAAGADSGAGPNKRKHAQGSSDSSRSGCSDSSDSSGSSDGDTSSPAADTDHAPAAAAAADATLHAQQRRPVRKLPRTQTDSSDDAGGGSNIWAAAAAAAAAAGMDDAGPGSPLDAPPPSAAGPSISAAQPEPEPSQQPTPQPNLGGSQQGLFSSLDALFAAGAVAGVGGPGGRGRGGKRGGRLAGRSAGETLRGLLAQSRAGANAGARAPSAGGGGSGPVAAAAPAAATDVPPTEAAEAGTGAPGGGLLSDDSSSSSSGSSSAESESDSDSMDSLPPAGMPEQHRQKRQRTAYDRDRPPVEGSSACPAAAATAAAAAGKGQAQHGAAATAAGGTAAAGAPGRGPAGPSPSPAAKAGAAPSPGPKAGPGRAAAQQQQRQQPQPQPRQQRQQQQQGSVSRLRHVMLGYITHVASFKTNLSTKGHRLEKAFQRKHPGCHGPFDSTAHEGHIYAVLFSRTRRQLRALQQHPLLTALQWRRKQVAAVIHVTSPRVAASQAFKTWIQGLPRQQVVLQHRPTASLGRPISHVPSPAATAVGAAAHAVATGAAAAAGGAQGADGGVQQQQGQQADVDMHNDAAAAAGAAAAAAGEAPPAADDRQAAPSAAAAVLAADGLQGSVNRAPADDVGFRASARVLARLNLVSRAMFPLPHALLGQQGLDAAAVAAVITESLQKEQQQAGMEVDGELQPKQQGSPIADAQAAAPEPPPAISAPAAAAAGTLPPHPQPQPTRPPKVVPGHFLQQLAWCGRQHVAVRPPLVPPLAYRDLMGTQAPLQPLDVAALQRELLTQRPKLQALLRPLARKWPGLTWAPQPPQLLLPSRQQLSRGISPQAASAAGTGHSSGQRGAPPGATAAAATAAAAAAGSKNRSVAASLKGQLVHQRKQGQAAGDAEAAAAFLPDIGDQVVQSPQQQQQQQQRPQLVLPGAYELSLESPASQQQQQQRDNGPKLPQEVLLVVQESDNTTASQLPRPTAGATAHKQQREQLGAVEESLEGLGITSDDGCVSDAADQPPIPFSPSWAPGTHIVFLGTGSAEPSKYRGPSAILLRVVTAGSSRCCCGGAGGAGSGSAQPQQQQQQRPRPPPGPPPRSTQPNPPGPAAGNNTGLKGTGASQGSSGGRGSPAAAAAGAAGPAAAAAAAQAGAGGDGVAYMLLDAGEGTLGAIRRLYGEADARRVLLGLSCIWVSHKHADHMLGVPALLAARAKLLQQLRRRAVRRQERAVSAAAAAAAAVGGGGGGRGTGVLQDSDCDSGSDSDCDGGCASSIGESRFSCASCLADVPPLLLVGPPELQSWLHKQPGSSGWDYTIVGVESFAGTALPVREQQRVWQQQQQQQGMHWSGSAAPGVAAQFGGHFTQQQQQQQMIPLTEHQRQRIVQQQRLLQQQQMHQQQMLFMEQQHQMAMAAMQQQHTYLMAAAAGCMPRGIMHPGMQGFGPGGMAPMGPGFGPGLLMSQGFTPGGMAPMGQNYGMHGVSIGFMPGPGVPGPYYANCMPGHGPVPAQGGVNGVSWGAVGPAAGMQGPPPPRPPIRPPMPPPGAPPPPSSTHPAGAAAAGTTRESPAAAAAAAASGVACNKDTVIEDGNSTMDGAAAATTAAAGGVSSGRENGLAQGEGAEEDPPWCSRMPPGELRAWQRWQAAWFAGSPAAGVMSGLMGFTCWRSVAVQHCPGAQGLVLEHSQGWKLVYSGDTRPCQALVAAGAGATLLIHEATFEAGMDSHALAKRHSTLQEALQVAEQMGAYRTALTHFSQRYPCMPAGLPADATPWVRRPLLAVDGAVLRFDLLPVLPALMPAVAAALEEVCEEDERQAGEDEDEGGDAGVEEEAGAAAVAGAAAPSGGCCG